MAGFFGHGLALVSSHETLIQITFGSFVLLTGLFGCSSNNSGSSSTAASIYSYVGGICYNTQANTPVASTYCTSTTAYNASMFSYNGTTCTNLQTGAAVSTAYCTSNPFTSNGSGCYDSIAATYVSTAYCSVTTTTNSGIYSYVNGTCVNTQTGLAVATTLCSTSATTVGGYTATPCYGPYYYTNGYTAQLVNCNGLNCRGYVLYSVSTKTPVVCQ